MAVAALRRVALDDQPVPVALGGGLMTARDPVLTAEITRRFADAAPKATIRIVDVPPVAGAALLGLDHIGAPPAAEARLRAAYLAAGRRSLDTFDAIRRVLATAGRDQIPPQVHRVQPRRDPVVRRPRPPSRPA
jgi:hypothetical protein